MRKYYIVYEENDEELSEDEERIEQRDAEVPNLHLVYASTNESDTLLVQVMGRPQVGEDNVQFNRIGAKRDGSDDGDASEQEKDAEQINTGQKE